MKITSTRTGPAVLDGWKCVEYRVCITHNGRCYTTPYYMGTAHRSAPTDDDVLYSLLSDASSAEVGAEYFADEFGYDEEEGERVYRDCLQTKLALERLFTEEELDALRERLEDY